MLDRLSRGRSAEALVFAGSRGTGKTVLLRECERRARAAGWFTALEEVDPDLPLRDVMALHARDVLFAMRASKRYGDRLKRAFGVLKAFTSIGVLGVKITIDADLLPGTADSGIFQRDLLALFEELGQLAASDSSGVLFLFDELHTLEGSEEMNVLDAVIHGVMQQGLPVSAVGAGVFAGPSYVDPDDAPSRRARRSTYSGRIYQVLRLKPLSDEAGRSALAGPAEASGVQFELDALALAVDFARGLPWFLQLVGDAAWEEAAGPRITDADVHKAIARTQDRLHGEFFPRLLGNLDEPMRAILGSFVALGDTEASLNELRHESNLSISEIAAPLMELIRRDIVGPALGGEGRFCLAIPRLLDYLAQAGV